MTLQELIHAVDELSVDERQQLRKYLDQLPENVETVHPLSPEERIRRLDAAVDAIREGLSQAELDEMLTAMNEEYIEPWDESEWQE